jgi:hypothetical protein
VPGSFQRSAAAAGKYAEKFLLLKATVAEVGDEVETKTVAAPPAPGATSQAAPNRRIRGRSVLSRQSGTRRLIRRATRSTATRSTPEPAARKVEVHHPYIVLRLPAKDGLEPLAV